VRDGIHVEVDAPLELESAVAAALR
jgi:hypothetical protein